MLYNIVFSSSFINNKLLPHSLSCVIWGKKHKHEDQHYWWMQVFFHCFETKVILP